MSSSSKLVKNSVSRNTLVSNKENVPLDTGTHLLPQGLDRSTNVTMDGKPTPGFRHTAIHGVLLHQRSVQSPITNKSAKDTPLKNICLQSLTSQENSSAATSNSTTVEELQKKYHSIVARMNQENEFQTQSGKALLMFFRFIEPASVSVAR